jgi:hypothetical protein
LRRSVTLLLCLVAAGPAQALRCDGGIVSRGDDTYELLAKCGEPSYIRRVEGPIVTGRVYDFFGNGYATEYLDTPYEVWYYDFGPRRLLMKITVRGDRITRIEGSGYGYRGDGGGER